MEHNVEVVMRRYKVVLLWEKHISNSTSTCFIINERRVSRETKKENKHTPAPYFSATTLLPCSSWCSTLLRRIKTVRYNSNQYSLFPARNLIVNSCRTPFCRGTRIVLVIIWSSCSSIIVVTGTMPEEDCMPSESSRHSRHLRSTIRHVDQIFNAPSKSGDFDVS